MTSINKSSEQPIHPTPQEPTTPSPCLYDTERLALHIIGILGLRGHLTRITINPLDGGLPVLYGDIVEALNSGLPQLDAEAIRRLMEGGRR